MSAPPELPEIVTRAFDVSRRAGYVRSAATRPAGCWRPWPRPARGRWRSSAPAVVSARPGCAPAYAGEGTRILTAELDPELAEAAAEIFRDDEQVEVLAADWSTLLDRGPFSLLFLDSGKPSASRPDKVAELMAEGGIVVLDDFTPCSVVAADLRRPGRHPARGVAQRRALHRGRGARRPRRVGRDRHQALATRTYEASAS